ncbi:MULTISPECIES: DUF308 domain-containing protein [Nesterenkonia]|uniref:DUF308 domain-containing protein n=1 Tax=Nesterenkonia xinjiangensis TaxID=225327 RepID=A0A7Z0KBM6_9MICC|nr:MULTISPECIES: DUF308 domain-containing protein [Nesterenkonia]MDZ5077150.1 DUF308 domain-containing protein [Nesterenkonia sp. HG001]NYJ77782.1 hypothetical protein [Nesterenkonia xinjiangensis]
MPVKRIPAPTAEALIRPVWLRAVITVVFAVVTIFWQDETLTLLKVSVAAYFVLGATAVWDYAKDEEVVPAVVRGPLALGAAVWVLSGLATVFVGTTTAAAVIAGVGFVAMGVAELVSGIRGRREFVPSRDQVLLGAVGTLTGVSLLVGMQLDVHGILGIAGMGVIIMAVLLMISGAGLVHEARRERD